MDQQDTRPFYQSATKIVFVILTVALVVGVFVGKVESKDFIYLVGQVFAFYFGQKFNASMSQPAPQKTSTP